MDWGSGSDQLTCVAAFDRWQQAKAQGFERSFCNRNFLSPATLNMVEGMRGQLLQAGTRTSCTLHRSYFLFYWWFIRLDIQSSLFNIPPFPLPRSWWAWG